MNEPLIIDPEFESIVSPLTTDEFNQLEENILTSGKVRDSITVWNGTIVDGHNRYRIIQKHPEIPYTVEEIEFSCRYAALIWICKNQLGRRNLTQEKKDYLLGEQYKNEKRIERFQGNQYTLADESGAVQNEPHQSRHQTRKRLAGENNVSESYIMRAEKYADGVDAAEEVLPGVKSEILSREIKPTKEEVIAIAQAPPEIRPKMAEILRLPKDERKTQRDILRKIAVVSARIDSDKPPVSTDSFLDSLKATVKNMMESFQTLFEQCPELLTNAVYFEKVVSVMQEVKQFIIKIESEKRE